MPDAPSTIYLGGQSVEAELIERTAKAITCLPGRVAVLMDEKESSDGGILLPLSGRMKPDTGTIVGSGVDGLSVGTRVATKAYAQQFLAGRWCESREFPWVPEGRTVKLFGVSEDWHEQIVVTLTNMDLEVTPTYDWVLIERRTREDGPIVRTTQTFESMGRVVGMGYWAAYKRVGDQDYKTGLELGMDVLFKGDALQFEYGLNRGVCLVRANQCQVVVSGN